MKCILVGGTSGLSRSIVAQKFANLLRLPFFADEKKKAPTVGFISK
jgi:hypothetical protein